MGILHDELRRAIDALGTDSSVMTEVLRRILRKYGYSLSDAQMQSLVHAIEEGADSVEVPTDGPMQSTSITSVDVERAMHELDVKPDTDAERTVTPVVEQLTPRILRSLYDALPGALREWHAAQREFEERLHRRWRASLDRLD